MFVARTLIPAVIGFCLASPAAAAEFPFNPNVKMKVGQSIILKGVRNRDCLPNAVPAWNRISGDMPRSKLGTLSNGGGGTTASDSCGKVVGARGVKFTARQKGSETLRILGDTFRITVE